MSQRAEHVLARVKARWASSGVMFASADDELLAAGAVMRELLAAPEHALFVDPAVLDRFRLQDAPEPKPDPQPQADGEPRTISGLIAAATRATVAVGVALAWPAIERARARRAAGIPCASPVVYGDEDCV